MSWGKRLGILGAISILTASTVAHCDPSFNKFLSGIEIGNGKGIDEKSGFELGNGRLFNREGMYQINKVFGKWEARFFNKFTELVALENTEGMPPTRVNIDVLSLENVDTPDTLVEKGLETGWSTSRKIGGLTAIRRDSISLSGIRQLEFRLFVAPHEVIKIDLIGPQRNPDLSAIELFQKSLETFHLVLTGK